MTTRVRWRRRQDSALDSAAVAAHEEILEAMLQGHQIAPKQIAAVAAERQREGLRVEYKSGPFLDDEKGAAKRGDPKKGTAKLRKWVAGFGNAVGGLLVVGVDAPESGPWSLTDLPKRLSSSDLVEWVGRALQASRAIRRLPRRFASSRTRGSVCSW